MKKIIRTVLLMSMAVFMFWFGGNVTPVQAAEGNVAGEDRAEISQEAANSERFQARTVIATTPEEMVLAVHEALLDQAPSVTVFFVESSIDVPGVFYSITNEEFCTYGQGNVAKWNCEYSSDYVTFSFVYRTTPEEELILDTVVENFRIVTEGMTDYQKILYVHNEICNIATYDYRTRWGKADNRSAFDILAQGKAVCSGYSLLFQRVMEGLDIPCRYTIGYANDGSKHAWNLVNIGDYWYHMDVTFDDQESGTTYQYFLLGADQINYTVEEYPVAATGYLNSLALYGYE